MGLLDWIWGSDEAEEEVCHDCQTDPCDKYWTRADEAAKRKQAATKQMQTDPVAGYHATIAAQRDIQKAIDESSQETPPCAVPTRLINERWGEMGTPQERLEVARRITKPGGTGTAADAEAVAQELAHMPVEDLRKLERQGIDVIATQDSITSYRTDLAGVTPRGWPPGSTWDQVPGAYTPDRREVVVGTIADANGNRIVPPTNSSHGSHSLVLHEAAHGLDHAHNYPSTGDVFSTAHSLDSSNLTSYQNQAGNAGLSEAFAEQYAEKYGGGTPTTNIGNYFDVFP